MGKGKRIRRRIRTNSKERRDKEEKEEWRKN